MDKILVNDGFIAMRKSTTFDDFRQFDIHANKVESKSSSKKDTSSHMNSSAGSRVESSSDEDDDSYGFG